jgi:hypothetical protein
MDSGGIFRFPILPPAGLSPFLGKLSPSGSSGRIKQIYQKKIRGDKLLDQNPGPPARPEAGNKFGHRKIGRAYHFREKPFPPSAEFLHRFSAKKGA